MRLQLLTIYTVFYLLSFLKCREMTVSYQQTRQYSLHYETSVLSHEQTKRLIGLCNLYDKALLSTIYDCTLRVSKVCRLKWIDICFERQQVFVYQGKGKKDRCMRVALFEGLYA